MLWQKLIWRLSSTQSKQIGKIITQFAAVKLAAAGWGEKAQKKIFLPTRRFEMSSSEQYKRQIMNDLAVG